MTGIQLDWPQNDNGVRERLQCHVKITILTDRGTFQRRVVDHVLERESRTNLLIVHQATAHHALACALEGYSNYSRVPAPHMNDSERKSRIDTHVAIPAYGLSYTETVHAVQVC